MNITGCDLSDTVASCLSFYYKTDVEMSCIISPFNLTTGLVVVAATSTILGVSKMISDFCYYKSLRKREATGIQAEDDECISTNFQSRCHSVGLLAISSLMLTLAVIKTSPSGWLFSMWDYELAKCMATGTDAKGYKF